MEAMAQIKGATGEIELNVLRDLLAKTPEEHKKFHADIEAAREPVLKLMADYEKSITTSEARELFDKLKTARDQYVTVRNQLLDLVDAGKMDDALQLTITSVRPAFLQYDQLMDQELTLNFKNGNQETGQTVKATDRAMSFILGISVIVMIFGGVIGIIITGGLNQVLRQLAYSLGEGSEQVALAANEVSASSQTLAEGASEQAAALEETSSSLEELASMTKRNAENAQKVNDLAKQARAAADKGTIDMQTMNAAMDAIKVSSDDIAKIIKTIDEIAFQTNILALNAAVEAARAGEAGMGFAVVADEVRNLAQRSAQAAKETAAKIEGAIGKTAQGMQISGKVAAALDEIAAKARQVDELAAEVAGASREQTLGITQINTAVGQMDNVTQANAASAEESAVAAEELNSQAVAMKDSVAELLQLVDGQRRGNLTRLNSATPDSHAFRFAVPTAKRPAPVRGNGHAQPEPARFGKANGRSEIPMDGDFRDF
jgi:methyl-accepting chemotaxis protein